MDEGTGRLRPNGSIKFEDNYGMVKIVWKHGVKSPETTGQVVTKKDIQALPNVLRKFKPVDPTEIEKLGRTLAPDTKYWAVTRMGQDGSSRQVLYAVRTFTNSDGQEHVVTVFAPTSGKSYPNSARR